ncbi:MAG: hypothetical protein STSR0003_28140 [Smithella sp.]
MPVQVPELLLPVLPVFPPVPVQVPELLLPVLQQRELLPAWVLLCCSLLLPETKMPRKAR